MRRVQCLLSHLKRHAPPIGMPFIEKVQSVAYALNLPHEASAVPDVNRTVE